MNHDHVFNPGLRARRRALWTAGLMGLCFSYQASAQLLYQEGFNDDGEKATPKRYTMTGRGIYEVDRIQAELNNFDQKGPIYWEHNFNSSFVGNPDIPARRMILSWRGNDATTVTEDFLKVIDSSVDWLLKGKKGAKVVIFPAASNCQALADRLTSLGHTVLDDDIANVPDERDVVGDLFIHAQGASNASRFVLRPQPVIVINSPDFDDMVVGSIGSSVAFTPGNVNIGAAGHPAAGGKTGGFAAFTAEQTFELTGSFLPPGAIKLATVTRIVPPAINRLGDVDSVIDGTKQNEKSTGSIAQIDLGDASAGSWGFDNAIPGAYAGNWGVQVKGKLNVTKAGTYRFAVGSDDGARLYIDRDRNGITIADQVLEDTGPHGHQIVYSDVTFAATGVYDLELRAYNSGGGGDVEVAVSNVASPVPDDALDSGYWEVLGDPAAASPVRLQGQATVTSFKAVGPNVEVQEPLITLLNGPDDVPRGAFYDGGAFTGFEGKGFIGAAGLNKWPYPEGQTYRSVTLKAVSVAGKSNVKVTLALAATQVDFETSDYVQIYAYPNGAASTGVQLANFHGVVNAFQPWLADEKEGFSRKLTKQFADFTYDIPAGATDLVIEVRMATTWWTEIAAVDNIRIHSGPLGGSGTPGQPSEFGKTVKGFQDDFTGATRNPLWVPRGPGGDLYQQADGLLRVTVKANDPNHLLYEAPGYNDTVQEVLARIRVTAFGVGDASRAGLGVGVQTAPAAELSRGINLHFRNNTQDGVTGKQFKLLDDARAWGPAGLKDEWAVNSWYWMRLRQDPNANGGTDDVFAKVWLADGKTEEPADWQLKWNYIPTRTARKGFAGITGSSIDGLGSFEVDYILIKADGLPDIKADWAPNGPAATAPRFTSVKTVSATQFEIEWVGAGNLEQADSPAGPWTVVANASSPRKINTTGAGKYYRLKQP